MLPYISPEHTGIGGVLKAEAECFVVEEIPLYEPGGEGEHIYLRLARDGWATRDIHKALARLFGLREVDVGYAGLKDKQARVTQTFSLALRDTHEEAAARRVREALPFEVLWAKRHKNKLKPGHLLGNRFRILVVEPHEDGLSRAGAIRRALVQRGLPNFYGAQRFGTQGRNKEKGRKALMGKGPRDKWTRRILLSAYQSALFNAWLVERIRKGWFETLIKGDVAKKTDTGGLFEVEDAVAESERFREGAITYTGPIYGAKMRWATGKPGDLEREVLASREVSVETLSRARLNGSRRPASLSVADLKVEEHPKGLFFTFYLPKGSYATTLMREFMKSDEGLPDPTAGGEPAERPFAGNICGGQASSIAGEDEEAHQPPSPSDGILQKGSFRR
jgi:tRNA pseudouridine13 synthase